jgi:hypothetical protein
VTVVMLLPKRDHRAAPSPQAEYWDARILPIDFGKADRTLVLAVSSNCQFCSRSMPFYRELLRMRGLQSKRIKGAPRSSLTAGRPAAPAEDVLTVRSP